MTGREIINNLICGKKAERIGFHDSPWGDTLQKWIKEGYPTKEDKTPVSPVEHFNFDMLGVGGWFDTLPIRGYKEVLEETSEWSISKDGAGAVFKRWKHKSGTPEHMSFEMTSREIWDKNYRHHLLEVDEQRLNIEQTVKNLEKGKKEERWTFYGHLFIWEIMRKSMGDICMYESLLLDPDWIHDFNRVYTDFFKSHYKLLFEKAGLPDGIWVYEDLGYKNGLFCSLEVLEELIFPYYKEIVEFFNSYNLPVVLHSCGNITDALPLIVDAGFAALNPMERKAGCDPLKFVEEYGDDLAFIGGLNAQVLESGDKELIKLEVIKLIEGMKDRGGRFVFGSDHSLSTNIAYQDFLYAIKVYREHMWY